MSEVCVKLDLDEVINILSHLDTLLKTNKVHLVELFDGNDKFDLSHVKNTPIETEDLLYDYFTNYSYGELASWLKNNIGLYNSFIQKESQKKPEYIKNCNNVKSTIVKSAAWLFNKLKSIKSGNLKINFAIDSTLCDLSTYHTLVNEFTLSNNLYYSNENIDSFTLSIDIDNISIRMDIENGFNDLYIFSVSQVDFDIYYDDSETQWPHNYQAKVLKYHDEDYIWINKSAIKTNQEDIKFMLDSVMFACFFPIIKHTKSNIPIFKISSIYLDGKEITKPNI